MGLRERLDRGGTATPVAGVAITYGGISPESYHQLKGELHQRLIDKIDLTTMENLPREQIREEMRAILAGMLSGSDPYFVP